MLVSIVTVYYNRENLVTESIESLLNQTYKNIEVIAIDDGSSDNTYEVLKSIKDPRLKVFQHKNMGFVKSIRKAIELAKGDIIAVHGSGDISYPERIEKQLAILNNKKEIGLVGCFTENINTLTNEVTLKKPLVNENSSTVSLMKSNIFNHGSMMYRRSVYEEVGGYRSFFKYAQDYDLWLRMSLCTKYDVVDEVLYTRFSLPDGVSTLPEKRVMQSYFVEISRQCIEEKLKGNDDLIEKYGDYAPFYMNKSRSLSDTLCIYSLVYLYKDDHNAAKHIIKRSINEKKTLKNLIVNLVIQFSTKNKLLKKLIVYILSVGKKAKFS